MKLTPLDIHHKEFRHALRGYSEEEVDGFLDDVADEFERLFKENIDLSEKLEAAMARVREFEAQKETLHNTLVAAQRSAEEIVGKSHDEADSVLKDAEVKAKEIIHNALTQKQKVQGELVRIKQAEEEFRGRFTSLLEGHLRTVSEISLPQDVTVIMGETDQGMIGEVEVATESARQAVADASAVPVDEPVMIPASEIDAGFGHDVPVASADEVAAVDEDEPPASGFVTGVMLGETESPDIAGEEPVFVDPREFLPGNVDELGERDDDLDIEEID